MSMFSTAHGLAMLCSGALLLLLPILADAAAGAVLKGTLTLLSRDAEVWDHRVRVMGTAEGADWVELGLLVGEQRIGFSPRSGFFEIEVPLEDGENLVKAVGRTAEGKVVESAPVRFYVPLGRAARGAELPPVSEARPELPAEQAIVYGTCVHLHSEKGLAGIIADLDRLAGLGCNAVWLNPTFPSGHGGFGYDVTDFFAVRDEYGDLAQMRELTRHAHLRGIRVLLDLVPNHTSDMHPYFQDALNFGEYSHYREFYHWKSAGEPRHYFHWTYLPNLNYDHVEVRRMMLEAGRFWVGRIGIDGFRVDVAWGVEERRPGFWREWSTELRRIYPHLLLVAEASARWPAYFDAGYDAAYDWDDGFLPAWRDVFESESKAAERLDRALRGGERGFPPRALVFRFVDNNDTGPRFHSRYGGDRARLACILLSTLPGIPLVYLGQENGAAYEPYKTSAPVEPGDDLELQDLYRRLLHLRLREPALTAPVWERLAVETTGHAYAYIRRAPGARSAAVVINFAGESNVFTVDLPETVPDGELSDEICKRPGRVTGGRLQVRLDAYSGAIFMLPSR